MSKETIRDWEAGGLPTAYRSFQQLELCSNKFVGAKIAMDISGVPLLLLGVGERCPLVWLSAPVAPDNKARRYVVEGYASFIEALTVTLDERRGSVDIRLGTTLMLSAVQLDSTSVKVAKLDFQPLGLKVFGDEHGLSIGGVMVRGNMTSGSHVAIGLR